MISEILSKYVYVITYEDLDKSLIQRMKTYILDFIGVSIYAAKYPWSNSVYQMITKFKSEGYCSIIGKDKKVRPEHAAFINGCFAHGIDWDDSHIASIVHPGAVVLPAALAIAELTNCNGKSFY